MKKVLIIALTVLCGAATAAFINFNNASQISELTKSNIDALTGIVVGPKTSNEDSKSHNPRIPLKETQTTTTTTTNPSTGETTTTTTTTEKYVPFCLNQSSEPCTE